MKLREKKDSEQEWSNLDYGGWLDTRSNVLDLHPESQMRLARYNIKLLEKQNETRKV